MANERSSLFPAILLSKGILQSDLKKVDEVLVQTTEPTSETNKLWINPDGEGEVQLALYSDIYSPFTKILDVTLEEESALIVTEIDGVPLSVKNELYIEVFVPSGNITSGNVRGLCGNTKICDGYHGALTNAINQYWHIHWKKDGGVWVSECDSFRTSNFVQPYKYMLSETYDGGSAYRSIFQYPEINNVTFGTLPADTDIKFFAR